ncbi:MAG: APC family permease [Candidatus Lokiarchaeota archaeon]|nr:APC family permease [Candidatus Harpocratesius repetitus]
MSENTNQKIEYFGLLALGLTTVIGSGIWGDPFSWVDTAGIFGIIPVIISWLLLFTAGLSYAEVVGMFPNSGGPYSYVSGAINKKWGSFLGFTYYLGYLLISVILTFVSIASFFGSINLNNPTLLVIFTVLLVIILSFVVELFPLKTIGWIALIWVAIKIILLMIVFIFFMIKGDSSNLISAKPTFEEIKVVGNGSLWALMGFEVILVLSGDLSHKTDDGNSKKKLPRGILIILGIILIIYIGVIIGVNFIVKQGALTASGLQAFEYAALQSGISTSLLYACKAFSSLGTTFAIFFILTYTLKVLAKGDSLPKVFSKTKKGMYINNAILTAVLSGIFALIMTILIQITNGIIINVFSYIGLGFILLSAMIPAGIIALYLRIKMPILERPFKTPIYYIVFPLSIVLGLYLFTLNLLALIGAL